MKAAEKQNVAGVKIAVIGGSGLDDPKILEAPMEIDVETPFGRPASSLTAGRIGSREVVILARHGKDHGIMPTKVPFRANIWALKEIGCTHILAATACGSLRQEIRPGDFVFPDQFIDFTRLRPLTFYEDKVVHAAMAEPFCPNLRGILAAAAKDLKIPCREKGTIITIEGPRFSTRAESRMFRLWGADIVNMTTIPEVVLAREMGICYASIAMATDYDCWKEGGEAVNMAMIMEAMEKNAENAKKMLSEVVSKVKPSECSCGK